ncbi:cytochrome b [Paraburkholderia elongata]|nr:cytochrome b/b6 domain-containing protein [Paraburkholderia elongata]
MNDQSEQLYRPWARRLHWITAALVLTMLVAGQRFRLDLPKAQHIFSLAGHSALGVSLLVVMLVRVVYRLRNPPPPFPTELSGWQHQLSALVHGALYILLFAVPVLGLVAASASPLPVQPAYLFNLTNLLGNPNEARFSVMRHYHDLSTWLLAALLAVHIAAALLHHYVLKDSVLGRMWPRSARRRA